MREKIFVLIQMGHCETKKSSYSKSRPNKKTIKLINELYKKNKIIIFTSRYMGRNNENAKKAKIKVMKKLLSNKIGVKFS